MREFSSPWRKSRGTKEKARRAPAVVRRGVRRMAIRVISSLRRKKRTTKPTIANVRRPKGYAPLPAYEEKSAESAAPRSWSGQALRNRPEGA